MRVKSIDDFQGEDDTSILSTVKRGVVGFLADNQRTNVALTRARRASIYSGPLVLLLLKVCLTDSTNYQRDVNVFSVPLMMQPSVSWFCK